ncbi:stage III sporulation protein AG [Neobacillus massiliamazoniensis]|jgi:stage III sporulation protein AG|uniref:SpoIIIAG n=1 Tax=Neobacillus massiliamazoniensis TaxID=1499688 RepID=A0A0U1P198_9BACI|nr:stage III sporulation protein AG [Neobacillus massiliamazoniensis]CRK84074.1 SpoIIIAG [Neobacillus massiliamazoniensis]
MDNNQGPFSWLKKWLKNDEQPEKKMGKNKYLILILCLGAAFMLISNFLFKSPSALPTAKTNSQPTSDVPAFGSSKGSGNKEITDYEKSYESQLKKALEEMLGVSDVTVVVTIDSTDKQILEKNKSTKTQTTEETDTQGGQRKVQDSETNEQLVITRNGDKELPIVVETKKPEIRSVLVVARGADNIQIKKLIVEAVTKGLGVPSYRVAVLPKNK